MKLSDLPANCEMLNDFVDVSYVCKMFNKGKITIRHWCQTQGLPYVLIPATEPTGRHVIRFKKSAVINWARERRKPIYQVIRQMRQRVPVPVEN